ncbi:family 43 glycosylhydrolase [Robertkochia solimangrovi]|uniref:glycoside hydrolase family 43 protein n=1 Tax=Robertkochia solimangrovi TaxID=2213046 RepID=UPI00117D4510|nr:glycoside hydrolase family 43 protein [Robertkochia solimangrovi]TRZ42047.1 glycosyl hydrolase family 43 [Robertkochia solimangrovi]
MKNILCIILLFTGVVSWSQTETFVNPLLPSGADPFSVYVDGMYYYTHTMGNRIVIWKTDNLAHLQDAESKTIWVPPTGTLYSKDIWAPEIHYYDGKWYVYFAADNGDNNTHRMYVLENDNSDPFSDNWSFKGKIAAQTDKWAIDGNVYRYKGKFYMVWSGWKGDENGQQNIYLAAMKNPLEIEGDRVLISSPVFDWEKHGDLNDDVNPPHVYVNEGPQFLEHDGRLFVVYSASGCWTDFYSLGLLSFNGEKDLLNSANWHKSNLPVFTQNSINGVYAPGHNSFFRSPDGTEDWILYHGNSEPNQGCGNLRKPRMQRIYWKEDGTPWFGVPVPEGVQLEIPAQK